jgi:hypothetical protein
MAPPPYWVLDALVLCLLFCTGICKYPEPKPVKHMGQERLPQAYDEVLLNSDDYMRRKMGKMGKMGNFPELIHIQRRINDIRIII